MVTYNGTSVNPRTKAMLSEVEKLSGVPLTITQGRNPGGVAASAGTHDGWGVVDIRAKTLTAVQRSRVNTAARMVGFASWIRNPSQFRTPTPWHIHAVAIGDTGLARAAKDQVEDYFENRNGLANNGKDDGPRNYVGVTWEKYLSTINPTPGDDMSAQDVKAINDYTARVSAQVQLHIDQMKDDFGNYAAAAVDRGLQNEFKGVNDRLDKVVSLLESMTGQKAAQ